MSGLIQLGPLQLGLATLLIVAAGVVSMALRLGVERRLAVAAIRTVIQLGLLGLVLVRLQGDKAEFTGVVAGMSGSPCTIDGKLLGALSYAFAMFAKEPIAGITPSPMITTFPDAHRHPSSWLSIS